MDIQEAKKAIEAYAAGNGVALEFDSEGACTLPLDDERALHLQFRESVGELDLLAILGTVPEDHRAYVFEKLLAANFYWKETLGATLSWQSELDQVVLTYPLKLATADEATLQGAIDRFVDLQQAWAERLRLDITEAAAEEELAEASLDLSELAELGVGESESSSPAEEIRFDA